MGETTADRPLLPNYAYSWMTTFDFIWNWCQKKIIPGKAFSGNLQNRQEPYYIIVNEQWTAYGWDKDKVDIAKIVD